MGWHGAYHWRTISDVKRDERASILRSNRILKEASTAYGRHWWLAIQPKDADGHDYKEPFILLVLIEKHSGDFMVKYIDESMGPVETDCPASILQAVPDGPTQGGYDFGPAWREKVRERLAKGAASRATAKALKPGDKVWLTRNSQGPFTIESVTPRKIVGRGPYGVLYRLPKTRIERVEAV